MSHQLLRRIFSSIGSISKAEFYQFLINIVLSTTRSRVSVYKQKLRSFPSKHEKNYSSYRIVNMWLGANKVLTMTLSESSRHRNNTDIFQGVGG